MISPIPTEGGHTPGPWFQDEAGICAASEDGGEIVAMVCAPEAFFGVDDDELPEVVVARLQANARLIAAAPALLKALTKVSMSAVIIPGMPSEAALPSAVLKEVAAALAQATGGEDGR